MDLIQHQIYRGRRCPLMTRIALEQRTVSGLRYREMGGKEEVRTSRHDFCLIYAAVKSSVEASRAAIARCKDTAVKQRNGGILVFALNPL